MRAVQLLGCYNGTYAAKAYAVPNHWYVDVACWCSVTPEATLGRTDGHGGWDPKSRKPWHVFNNVALFLA